jgi:FkbM family methyltransferase
MNLSDKIKDEYYKYKGLDFYNSSFNTNWIKELGIETPGVIFDIGAYDFGDSIRFKMEFPNANVFSFECDPVIYEARSKYAREIGVITEELALCKIDGQIEFYQSLDENSKIDGKKGSPQGSIYRHSDYCKSVHSHINQNFSPIMVNCSMFDSYCIKNNIGSIDLAHIDVEGAEMDIISTMRNYKPKILYIETQNDFFIGIYSVDLVHEYLVSSGYELLRNLISDRLYVLK